MTEQFYEAWQGPRNLLLKQDRLSLSDFVRLARTHLIRINRAQADLQTVHMMSSEQGCVRSDQCDEAVSLVRRMEKSVEDFSHLMDQKASLPLVILPLRYQLDSELSFMKERLWMTLAYIGRLRSTRRNISKEVMVQHDEVIRKVATLLKDSKYMVQTSYAMLDQARFQERRNQIAALDMSLEDTFRNMNT